MQVKQFLVQFHSDERTRWIREDKEIASTISGLAYSAAFSATSGATPAVQVLVIENAEVVDAGALAVLQTKAGIK